MKKERKKESKNLLWAVFFFLRGRKMATARRSHRNQDSGHDSSVCRPNGYAAQHQSSKCRFPRSALQTSPYDVRKTTNISTTCTYYRENLTVRALRSSRTIENKHAQIAELILLRSCVRPTVLSTEKVSISFAALLPDSPQSGRCPMQESWTLCVPGCPLPSWEPPVIASVVQEGNYFPWAPTAAWQLLFFLNFSQLFQLSLSEHSSHFYTSLLLFFDCELAVQPSAAWAIYHIGRYL